jgi:ParB family chromosome partitioning protein
MALTGIPTKNTYLVAPEELVIVGLDTPVDHKHPLYDERVHMPLPEWLVLNISVHGVRDPIHVRRSSKDEIEVIDGRQRVRAAREVNRRFRAEGRENECIRVMVVTRKGENADLAAAVVAGNEGKQGNTLVYRARQALKLLGFNKTYQEIAVLFNVHQVTIRHWIELLEKDPQIILAVQEGRTSLTTALGLPDDVDVEAFVAETKTAGPKKSGPKKGTIYVTRPNRKQIKAKLEACMALDPDSDAVSVLNWVLGAIPDSLLDKELKMPGSEDDGSEDEAPDSE